MVVVAAAVVCAFCACLQTVKQPSLKFFHGFQKIRVFRNGRKHTGSSGYWLCALFARHGNKRRQKIPAISGRILQICLDTSDKSLNHRAHQRRFARKMIEQPTLGNTCASCNGIKRKIRRPILMGNLDGGSKNLVPGRNLGLAKWRHHINSIRYVSITVQTVQ